MSNNTYLPYLKADGFNRAIIGICREKEIVIYDRAKMLEVLMEDEEMDEIDALEYLEFNVWSSYVGEYTPMYIDVMTIEDINSLNL
jgi:hypothetical protein